jgi:hypothetical protein
VQNIGYIAKLNHLGHAISILSCYKHVNKEVAFPEKYAFKIPRNHVAWDQQNMRWEASP